MTEVKTINADKQTDIGIFTKKEKHWIRHLITAYVVLASMALIYLAVSAAKIFPVIIECMNPEFVNYGNDTVSGWATIFSLLGFLAGTFLMPFVFVAYVIYTALIAAYWIAGMVLSVLLKKKADCEMPCKKIGLFFTTWAVVPCIYGLYISIRALFKNGIEIETVFKSFDIPTIFNAISLIIPVASIAIGIFVFVIVCKNIKPAGRQSRKQ